jgi:hypothetical protein
MAYAKICDFVGAMSQVNDQRGLQMYRLLLARTPAGDNRYTEAVAKHESIFREFVESNRDFVLEKSDVLVETSVSFSTKVSIDVQEIFAKLQPDEKQAMRQHMLLIYHIFNKDDEEASACLQRAKTSTTTAVSITQPAPAPAGVDPVNLMNSMLGILGPTIMSTLQTLPSGGEGSGATGGSPESGEDVTAAIKALLESDVLTNVITSIKHSFDSGKINPAQIIQALMANAGTDAGGAGAGAGADLSGLLSMIGPLLAKAGTPGEAGTGEAAPDLSGVMSMLADISPKSPKSV